MKKRTAPTADTTDAVCFYCYGRNVITSDEFKSEVLICVPPPGSILLPIGKRAIPEFRRISGGTPILTGWGPVADAVANEFDLLATRAGLILRQNNVDFPVSGEVSAAFKQMLVTLNAC